MELPARGRPWMLLDRVLHRVLHVAGEQADEAEASHGADGLAPGDVVNREQAWLAQQVIALDCYEEEEAVAAAEAAQEAQAALPSGHHFTVSVNAPPLISFINSGITYPRPPATPARKKPYILAAGSFCLLAHFSEEPPRDPDCFYYFSPPNVSHLVVVRGFYGGADGRTAAKAELVPDRGDDVPKLLSHDVEIVGFLCDDNERTYTIAELKVGTDSHLPSYAVLTCYRSVTRAWSSNMMETSLPLVMDTPLPRVACNRYRQWIPHGAVSLDGTVVWFDLSWGLLSMDFNLHHSEFRLDFTTLPDDRTMSLREADKQMAHIYDRRCITVSENVLRFVEIIVCDEEAEWVIMWSRRRGAGVNGGFEWVMDVKVYFENLWDSESYIETGLPRKRPLLAFVNPVNSDEVYFTISFHREHHLFGVNLRELRVVHSQAIGKAHRGRFLTWNLPKREETSIEQVEPQQDALHQELQGDHEQ